MCDTNSAGKLRKVHVVVRGIVQGVGFRYYARAAGQELGISGWVRNLPDGCVEVQGTGSAGHIAEFIRRVSIGPLQSRVTDVDVSDVDMDDAGYVDHSDTNEGFKILL